MPLFLTPVSAFATTSTVEVATVYAIIDEVHYSRRHKTITFTASYFASEAACDAQAAPLLINALPGTFSRAVTPEAADSLPIFTFLEQELEKSLKELHPDLVTTPV